MARHMICVSRRPEEPTIPPTATSRTLEIAIPAIAPATPDSEFRSEIATGMSAPPTRIANSQPNSSAATAQTISATILRPKAAQTTPARHAMSSAAETMLCPLNFLGRLSILRASFKAAMREPVKVIAPITSASAAVTLAKTELPAFASSMPPTSALARPPMPFNSATV